jgi:hypothetical protein
MNKEVEEEEERGRGRERERKREGEMNKKNCMFKKLIYSQCLFCFTFEEILQYHF